MILAKRNAGSGFLNYMQQKYCQGEDEDLPDEAAFEAAAANSKKRVQKSAAAKAQPKKRAKKWSNSPKYRETWTLVNLN